MILEVKTCPDCNSVGHKRCLDCNGIGSEVFRCNICDGKDYVYEKNENEEYIQVSCSNCSGTGEILKTCRACNGAGNFDCSTCNGTGEIPD